MARFRTLDEELGGSRAAGFHDLRTWHVHFPYSAQAIVTVHESIHARLLSETPTGTTHAGFKALEDVCSEQTLKASVHAWTQALFAASRLTHERFATYMSVRRFPQAQQAELRSSLPPEYVAFHDTIAHIIDPAFHSSYLQFLVAVVFGEICFSSLLQERLCDWKPGADPVIGPAESPDERFELLAIPLSARFLELSHSIDNCISDPSTREWLPAGFKPQSEQAWGELEASVAVELDDLILETTRKWFHSEASRLTECLALERWSSVRQSFFDNLARVGGVTLPVREEAYGEEVSAGRSSILNVPPIRGIQVARLAEAQALAEALLRANDEGTPATLSMDATDFRGIENLEWLLATRSGESRQLRRVPHALLSELLVSMGTTPRPSGPRIDAFVIGPRWNEARHFFEVYTELLRIAMLQSTIGYDLFTGDEVFWYMGGDFFGWRDFISRRGSLECMVLRQDALPEGVPNTAPEETKLREAEHLMITTKLGLVGYVFHSPGFYGNFMRWFAGPVASFMIGAAINRDFNSKKLHAFGTADFQRIGRQAEKTLVPIRLSWREF